MPPGPGRHSGRAVGSPATGPACTERSSRRSSTDAASGPHVVSSCHHSRGSRPTTPFVGLIPASPQKAAGIRIEPPVSVAVAIGAIPAATAAPEPPLEPPGDQSGAQGLRVTPNRRFPVKPSQANSGVFVLPTGIAPAARSRPGTSPSRSAGGASANKSEPYVVGKPLRSSMSFTRNGTPASGPASSPRATRSSRAAASARASSARSRTTAFSSPSRFSMRCKARSTSSRAKTRRARTASARAAITSDTIRRSPKTEGAGWR